MLNQIKKIIFVFLIIELILRGAIALYTLYYLVIAKPPADFEKSAFRILCVGESTALGHPVNGNGYPEQLERLLNQKASGRKYKVYNLGVCAITSKEIARHFYKNVINYKPHLAIILAGHNDNTPLRACASKGLTCLLVNSLSNLKIIKLFNFSYEIVNGLINRKLEIHRTYSDIYLSYNVPNYIDWEGSDHRKNLEYMINVALKNKCKILLCNYFQSGANSFLRKLAVEKNIPFCDNEKVFEEYRGLSSDLISEDGWHPNAKGYAIMAKNLYEIIVKNRLTD